MKKLFLCRVTVVNNDPEDKSPDDQYLGIMEGDSESEIEMRIRCSNELFRDYGKISVSPCGELMRLD